MTIEYDGGQNKIEVRAYSRPHLRCIDFYGCRGPDERIDCSAVSMDSRRGDEPSFSLRYEEAQALMDSLWGCGLKPTGAAGSAGQLTAVQSHLEDMRQIAFEGLEIHRPEDKK